MDLDAHDRAWAGVGVEPLALAEALTEALAPASLAIGRSSLNEAKGGALRKRHSQQIVCILLIAPECTEDTENSAACTILVPTARPPPPTREVAVKRTSL